jgi:uncharacterized protein YbjT (DUF2867 family)
MNTRRFASDRLLTMNILVVGSTGPQGREVVAQALVAGHAVRALARNPSALQPEQGLEVVRGDVFDQRSLDAAANGQDAAVVILGLPFNALRKPTNLFSQGTRNMIAALKPAGVRRLIAVSSFGVGDSRRDAKLIERAFFSLALRGAYADKDLQERAVRESGLDYTIIRPARLTMGAGTGRYTARVGPGSVPSPVARADVARFILDALRARQYVGQTVSIGKPAKGG